MSRRLLLELIFPLLLISTSSLLETVSFAAGSQRDRVYLGDTYCRLPLNFEINKGQIDRPVRFFGRTRDHLLYFTDNEVVLVRRGERESQSLKIRLANARRRVVVEGLEQLPGKSNYFRGRDRSKWLTDISSYARLRYGDVYPGIDLIFYGNQGQLEFDFILTPGADVNAIRMSFRGAEKLTRDKEGSFIVDTLAGRLFLGTPSIYQNVGGARRPVCGEYILRDDQDIGFRLGDYDRRRPLIIDPVLSFSTYLGSQGDDGLADMATDSSGNIYVIGNTGFGDFPVTPGALQASRGGIFISKLSPTGSTLIYSTYLGEAGDTGRGIAVDAVGNVYITGNTSSANFPTVNPIQASFRGRSIFYGDAFVAKLNVTGSALLYATYLGGEKDDRGMKIAVDPAGNAYVTGETISADFPTVKPFQPVYGGGETIFVDFSPSQTGDAFIAKLNPAGSALIYSSYLGGARGDIGMGITVDAFGNAYITGGTSSSNFPVLKPLQNFTGSPDAFVTKVNSVGALVYSTYFGGSNFDRGNDIAVDGAGNVFIVGSTDSTDLPVTKPLQASKRTGSDVFVTEINATGSEIIFSTYLGGDDNDFGESIALHGGNIFVSGRTGSTNFPLVSPVQSSNRGNYDAFLTKLQPTAILYSTYIGGSGEETVGRVAVDAFGNAYVGGSTRSADFPTTSGVFQPSFAGGSRDAFILKISDDRKLYFAQFGNGSQGTTSLFSQLILVNLDSTAPAHAVVEINDDTGAPMSVNLNGSVVAGRKDLTIPADGSATLKTDSQGPVQAGSVTVTSDRNISGVLLFGGSVGTAGVGDSKSLRKFVAPMETGSGINTGIAMMGLAQGQTIQLELELRNEQGLTVARGSAVLGARSHTARFLTELQWDAPVDFSHFFGTLIATGTADFAATVIRVSPGQFTTMPVAEKN